MVNTIQLLDENWLRSKQKIWEMESLTQHLNKQKHFSELSLFTNGKYLFFHTRNFNFFCAISFLIYFPRNFIALSQTCTLTSVFCEKNISTAATTFGVIQEFVTFHVFDIVIPSTYKIWLTKWTNIIRRFSLTLTNIWNWFVLDIIPIIK